MIIVVRGIPAPQGSKRHVGGGRMIESSRAVGPWREAVRAETQRAMEAPDPTGWIAAYDGPVKVGITFTLTRPKTNRERWPIAKKRNDIDKLARAVLDGITDGGAIDDDARVVQLAVQKKFASPGTAPGCIIKLEEA